MGNRDGSAGCACGICGRETELFLCWGCIKKLKRKLDYAAWLAAQLQVTVTRRARMTLTADRIAGSPEKPLPYHYEASDVAWNLHNTLSAWAKDVCETRGLDYPGNPDTAGVARWLSDNVVAIAAGEGAKDCYDEVLHATNAAERAIDRPPPNWIFLGPCGGRTDRSEDPCVVDIYAKPRRSDDGAPGRIESTVVCPACNTEHDVEARRAANRELVRAALYTASEIEDSYLDDRGLRIKAQWIRVKANRGQLFAHAKHPRTGEAQYRLGEVVDEWKRASEKRQKQRA